MLIQKADGTSEEFSEKKLRDSIKRAGVPPDMTEDVVAHVKTKLYHNMPTAELYHHVSEFLEKSPQPFTKAKYTLKQALMDLGPTGYPFEDYVAKILEAEGYHTKVRQVLAGKCVSHEIDVIAEKGKEMFMVEAKFHNGLGTKTDVQVSLYTKARFDDVSYKYHFTKACLVTNTKATSDAIAYAQCVGMDIIGWSYPEGGSLRDLVEKLGLYPLTVLSTLPEQFKQLLFAQNIVICRDVTEKTLAEQGIPEHVRENVMKELGFLCHTSEHTKK